MFQVIFIFSDWIYFLIVTSVLPFPLGRKHIFKKFYLEFWGGDWGTSKNASIQCIFNSINYVLSKILKNDAKFIQKLAPGFKNHMKNLNNFTQAVESPKSWNLMGYYFCPKNTFLRLKHYIQRILTFFSTTCVKTHQISYVIFETISYFPRHNSDFSDLLLLALNFTKFLMSFFEPRVCFSSNFASFFSVMRHNSSLPFHLNIYMLWTKGAHKSANFQTLTVHVKVN